MAKRSRHNYDAEFKRSAAALYVSGGKSLSDLTFELGVAQLDFLTGLALCIGPGIRIIIIAKVTTSA